MRIIPILAFLFVLIFLAPAVSAETLSQKEIESELIGKKLSYSGAFSGKITYRPGGGFVYSAGNGNKLTGRWHFKGNKLCTKFDNNFRGGRVSCFTFKKIRKTLLCYQSRIQGTQVSFSAANTSIFAILM